MQGRRVSEGRQWRAAAGGGGCRAAVGAGSGSGGGHTISHALPAVAEAHARHGHDGQEAGVLLGAGREALCAQIADPRAAPARHPSRPSPLRPPGPGPCRPGTGRPPRGRPKLGNALRWLAVGCPTKANGRGGGTGETELAAALSTAAQERPPLPMRRPCRPHGQRCCASYSFD